MLPERLAVVPALSQSGRFTEPDSYFMIVCVQDDVEIWLQRVCKQIEIPNARLEFHSAADSGRDRNLSHIPRHHFSHRKRLREKTRAIVWESSICKGRQSLGKLCVRIDEGETLNQSFLDACQLADTLSRMAADYTDLKESLQNLGQREPSGTADEFQQVNVLVEQTMKTAVKLTGYRGAAFFLLDEDGTSLRLKHYCHQSLEALPNIERDLRNACFDREALINDVCVCTGHSKQEKDWLPNFVSTGVCFKVATSDGPVGTLWFFDRRFRTVNDRDYHVLQSIAVQLGTILDRVILFRQSANHRRLKTELRLASATQPAQLLEYQSPDQLIDCYGRCLSQFDLGGDLCELIPLGQRYLFVVVGDASGNSIPAAMVMTAVRGAVYAMISEIEHPRLWGDREETANLSRDERLASFKPGCFMENLNRMLVNLTDAHQFMSAVCGLFDLQKMTFTFCNAGHPSPIHLSGKSLNYLPSHGLLLGIDGDINYRQDTISLLTGDVLALYTDGVSEAMSRSTHRLFRQDGIAAAARLSMHQNAETIFQSIWNRMLAHSAGNQESDDATALVIKLQSPS